jgi:hypothetical protein
MEVNVLKEDVSVQAHLKELAVRKVILLRLLCCVDVSGELAIATAHAMQLFDDLHYSNF